MMYQNVSMGFPLDIPGGKHARPPGKLTEPEEKAMPENQNTAIDTENEAGAGTGTGTDTGTGSAAGTTPTMLQKCMNMLGVTDPEYEDEIQDLIDAAKADLGIAGVTQNTVESDALIKRAIKTYVAANFGAPENYQQLLASYEMQKGQLMSATGYTDWLDGSTDEAEDAEEDDGSQEAGGEG